MKIFLQTASFVLVTAISFWSCNKNEEEPPQEPASTGRLHKVKVGSSTTVYYYDAAGKVARYTQLVPFSDSVSIQLLRNNVGEPVKVIVDYGNGDVEVTNVTYRTGTTEILHYVHTDGALKDSNLVTYNGWDVTVEHYPYNNNTQQYEHAARTVFSIMNGNLRTLKQYYMGLAQPHRQVQFTYDTKNSPFHFTASEVVILGMEFAALKNNVIKEDVTFPTNISQPYSYTHQHTYNSLNNPTLTVITDSRTNSKEQVAYFYQ